MKKSFNFLVTLAASAIALIACSKEEQSIPVIPKEDGIQVIINTGSPVTMTMMSGTNPYWCDGDAIGVSTAVNEADPGDDPKYNNFKFNENSIGEGLTAETATFRGTVTKTGTYYAYYPYTSNGVGAGGAKVDIPAIQYPTVSSFDGKADLLVSKPFTVSTTETTNVEGLEFGRLGAIVKVVLIDDSATYDLSSEHPTSISITAASDLVGRAYIDMKEHDLGALYSGQSTKVTAEYTPSTKFAINGTNAAYLIVFPQTLEAGSTLTVKASTEKYDISKDISVPAGGIVLNGGAMATLRISLTDSHITPSSKGDALPFDDDMAWANNGASDNSTNIASSVEAASSGLYTSAAYLYKGIGGAKLGSSSNAGSITTKALDLSGAFYVLIRGGKYNTDTGTLVVTIDGDEVLNEAFASVNFVNIPADTYSTKSTVTIGTSAKRGRLYSVEIHEGTYVPDPVITVTSSNPMAIDNTNDLHSIEYTITYPTTASISASANVAWIHDFDYSVDGEVCFEVDAQTTGAAARSGVITLSYTGAEDVVVTVNQEAGPVAGQVTLYQETFGDNGSSNTLVANATCYTATTSMFADPANTVVSHYSSDGKVGKNSVNPSDTYAGASGNSAVWYTGAGKTTTTANLFTVENIDISSATGITVSFGLFHTNAAGTTVTAYYTIDNGVEQALSFSEPSSNNTWTLCAGTIAGTGSSLKLRFQQETTGGYTGRIDDIKVVGAK